MIINSAEITFLSRSSNESFARMAVAAFVAQLDPTIEELSEIKTSVSEAVTNCIVHAYNNDLGTVKLKMQITDTNSIKITVRDFGCGINDVGQAMEPCYTTGAEDRAGMGFTIMDSFSDRLRVSSVVGKGTKVVMERKIIKRG